MRGRVSDLIFHPTPKVGRTDNGLRFTDILFGFVIKELFVRLAHWGSLPWFQRAQLLAGAALVLGSWLGFRQSLNRSKWELRFFNLPLLRFLLDQLMIVLYFRVATLTPQSGKAHNADSLAHRMIWSFMSIFALYLAWDLFGLLMARAKKPDGSFRYPKIDDSGDRPKETAEQAERDKWGILITVGMLAALVGMYFGTRHWAVDENCATFLFFLLVGLMLLYRWLKEIRTTWKASNGGLIPEGAPASS